MGRPPSNGAPAFRFNPPEVAEMESTLQAHNISMPAREVLVALAEKFSASPERSGKITVQIKQVWNWFQNRRYALRAKATKAPSKLGGAFTISHDDSAKMRIATQLPPPAPAVCAAMKSLPQPPQILAAPSAQSTGRNVSDNSQMEFEAKSARDGAWYDVALFLSHKHLDTGDPEVLIRFSGFGSEEDEWINVRKHVRQRSLPCESSECVAVLSGDLILCFQEGKEQALYFDAHVLDAQRRRHDVRGCRCRFLVRYDHDQSEEIVPLRKVCRRPETDYRLQQLHAANELAAHKQLKSGVDPHHMSSTLRVYPPPGTVQKQQKAVAHTNIPASTISPAVHAITTVSTAPSAIHANIPVTNIPPDARANVSAATIPLATCGSLPASTIYPGAHVSVTTATLLPSTPHANISDGTVLPVATFAAAPAPTPSVTYANVADATTPSASQANVTDAIIPPASQANVTDATIPPVSQANVTDATMAPAAQVNATGVAIPSAVQANVTDVAIPSAVQANVTDVALPSAIQTNVTDVSIPSAAEANVTDATVTSVVRANVNDTTISSPAQTDVASATISPAFDASLVAATFSPDAHTNDSDATFSPVTHVNVAAATVSPASLSNDAAYIISAATNDDIAASTSPSVSDANDATTVIPHAAHTNVTDSTIPPADVADAASVSYAANASITAATILPAAHGNVPVSAVPTDTHANVSVPTISLASQGNVTDAITCPATPAYNDNVPAATTPPDNPTASTISSEAHVNVSPSTTLPVNHDNATAVPIPLASHANLIVPYKDEFPPEVMKAVAVAVDHLGNPNICLKSDNAANTVNASSQNT